MSWNWVFWRRGMEVDAGRPERPETDREPHRIDEWEARLVEQGVSSESAGRLADRLWQIHRRLGRGSAAGLLEGVLLATELQAEACADIDRHLRDVREVERLLGAFTGELEKLDEVLEVLAAYAQRMRSKPIARERRTLH